MITTTEASLSWAQALSWRLERQFLDPVGDASVAEVVHRLGAVLSMDEALAEVAVRTRSASSRPGDFTTALAEGEVIKRSRSVGRCTTSHPRRAVSTWR